ncbi:MAG: chorismate-binding protein, partial [Candidatus Hydrogenedentes bacterium]|nr:chorismate-binding protein [Candidatus Hydrogenedentota bacterium]
MLHPSLNEFREVATPGALVPMYREILADLETPVSAYMKIACGQSHAFLFESVEQAGSLGQYSFIGANPSVIFRAKGKDVTLTRGGEDTTYTVEKPLHELRSIMAAYQPVEVAGLPEFHGGAVGYLSYDQVRFFETLPDENPDTLNLPDLYFVITDTMLLFDHANNRSKIVANVHVEGDPDAAYAEGMEKIAALEAQLKRSLDDVGVRPEASDLPTDIESNFSREAFCDIVRRAKEYICAGDIFQVVLSQRFRTKINLNPLALYRALRHINPSPYLFYLKLGDLVQIGSSPEILVRLEGSDIELRPIAGTRPRGDTSEIDLALEKELLADPKERAEHLMLVDLGRNDVGRVAGYGSVEARDLLIVERYSHVMHIVSSVHGELEDGKDMFDGFKARFPAGTVSGSPKIRAMEIIEELGSERRGPYA